MKRYGTFQSLILFAATIAMIPTGGCQKAKTSAPPNAVLSTTRPTTLAFTPVSDVAPKPGDRFIERLKPDSAEFEIAFIPGGKFMMGSPDDEPGREPNEGPQHSVRVEPFWMGRCEVTADLVMVWLMEWEQIRLATYGRSITLNANSIRAATQFPCERPYAPFHDRGVDADLEDCPVVTISAYGAQQFCRWLTLRTGHYYRLPTEAEWEYACRAGTKTAYFFGTESANLPAYAWFKTDQTHIGARKRANPWGLYDMHGNVGEYVLDGWADDYHDDTGKTSSDPWCKHYDQRYAVVRGGDYSDDPSKLRAASRRRILQWQDANNNSILFDSGNVDGNRQTGFRVVSPLKYEGDGREACIPPPKYP